MKLLIVEKPIEAHSLSSIFVRYMPKIYTNYLQLSVDGEKLVCRQTDETN